MPMKVIDLPTLARKRFMEEFFDYLHVDKQMFVNFTKSRHSVDNYEISGDDLVSDAVELAEAWIKDQEAAGYKWCEKSNAWV